ncbi:MAG: Fic family protein [Desulfovibrionaceae bacterium]|uniref:Fic family protein n=1 Tax=Bilophila wadsworthia TaxID=35833 RepID=UPI003220020C|nr:Fic family protein [Desulfovibrionaceae bacterium]
MKDTAELFASLDALKARLDAHRPLPADIVSQIRQDMRIRFTYHSNAIEGNTLTMSETKAVLEDGITIGGKSLKEHLEAVGHSHAIDYMEALVQKDEALTERTLKEIHNLILRNIDGANAGTYRRMNVLISGAGHIPPPAERVLEKMEAFFRWYGAARGALHPVEFAARVHADFVNIHPFKDGNGRTARLIMNFELMRAGFPTVIVPVDARPDYYRNLDIAATQGDYLPFVMQIAELAQKSFAPYWALLGE